MGSSCSGMSAVTKADMDISNINAKINKLSNMLDLEEVKESSGSTVKFIEEAKDVLHDIRKSVINLSWNSRGL